jgi:transcriptional regulator with XRE-family HTH domain
MTMPKLSNLSLLFWAYRFEQKLSLRELAEETGISRSTLSRIERGQRIDLQTWLQIQAWMFHEAKP